MKRDMDKGETNPAAPATDAAGACDSLPPDPDPASCGKASCKMFGMAA